MFERSKLSHAVDLQQRSFLLLQWLIAAIKKGFIDFGSAHTFATLPDAASAWIQRHYANIPENARPAKEDVTMVAAFLSTYLENSYDMIEDPGKRLYSPDAHCFCPMCSWLVEAPNLKPKRITTADKRRAEKLRIHALSRLATESGLEFTDDQFATLLKDDAVRENASLVAYGLDLFQRMDGVATGPAILALWRSFAWKKEGSPKQGFRLKAHGILDAERELTAALRQAASPTET